MRRGARIPCMRVVGFLLQLFFMACSGDSNPPPEPTVPPGHIVFLSRRLTGSQDIFIARADGSDLRTVTSTPDVEENGPVISPDGSRIAFWANQDGRPEIFVIRSDGTGLTRVTHDTLGDAFPAWSPDGTRLAFTRAGGSASDLDGIFIVNADGTGEVQVPGVGPEPELAWSPDGAEIAFNGIASIHVDGTGARTITSRAETQSDPAWSPDGTRIAYGCVDPVTGSQEICVVNRDGSSDAFFTQTGPPAGEIQPTWSPDGAFIAFAGRRGPDFNNNLEIVVRNVATGEETLVTQVGADDTHPSWGP
jgi:TolB protein